MGCNCKNKNVEYLNNSEIISSDNYKNSINEYKEYTLDDYLKTINKGTTELEKTVKEESDIDKIKRLLGTPYDNGDETLFGRMNKLYNLLSLIK